MSPTPLLRFAVQRLLLFSHHQGEQASAQCAIPVGTSQPHARHRKSTRDKAGECWLRRCSCRTEKHVQLLQEFITLTEKVLCQAHLTFEAQGDLSRCTHTNGNRAETQEAYRRHIPQEKEYGPSIKKFGITSNYEQIKQSKEKRQPYQDSLKRNITRDFILKSKGISPPK